MGWGRVKVQASKTNKDRWINQAEGDAQAIKGEPTSQSGASYRHIRLFIPFVCLASDLIPIVSTGIRTPPEASIPESHPTSVSPRQTVNLFQRNTISHISVHVQTYITQQSNQISPYWKQCNVLEWFVLENDSPSFILRPMCFFYVLFYGLDLIWKGKVFIFQRCEKSIYSA